MELDILAFGVHPDDVELSCSGTLLKQISQGYSAGIIDLSKGELGSRGTPELRLKEAEKAAAIMGISVRENLGMEDGFFMHNPENIRRIVQVIRKYKPSVVLANAIDDRHPDHGRAAKLIADACFYSGLVKIETEENGMKQERHRPVTVLHYIQDRIHIPDIVVDITDFFPKKMEAIMAFSSQFYKAGSGEPDTPISSKSFMDNIAAKANVFGRYIFVPYAEGFKLSRPAGVDDINKLL